MTGSGVPPVRVLALVAAGGATGTLLRHAVSMLGGSVGGDGIWVTATINLTGAFALGILFGWASGRESASPTPDTARRVRSWRILLGTGVLGAFTTYSALAVDAATTWTEATPGLALGYALGTVVTGGAAAVAGIVTGTRLGSPRRGRSEGREGRA